MLTSLKQIIHSWKNDDGAKDFYKAELKQLFGYFIVWLVIYIIFIISV